ncbi:MAG: hypothetical protein HQM13_18115 [SAR324 cluster bacterium]|nr:hypothetical protein [SAR324 cluster bacterium]
MKKKTLQSKNQETGPHAEKLSFASSDWKRSSSETVEDPPLDLSILKARLGQQETSEHVQEQVPMVQITLSVFQVGQSFNFSEEKIVEDVENSCSGAVPHLIGLGRSHRSQWTMVTTPMIGIAKKQGKVKIDF